MSARPPVAAGVVVAATGALLLTLGLGPGGGEPRGAAPVALPMSVGADTMSAFTALGATSAGAPSPSAPSPSTSPASVSGNGGVATGSVDRRLLAPRTSAVTDSTPRAPGGVTLAVSSIGLQVPVSAGGVSPSGTVLPPVGRAMWVQGHGRVAPGDLGTAVVAGHVASFGEDDVFADLSSIRVGHTLVLTTGSQARSFVVRRASVVAKSDLTHDPDVWGANDSQRRVVLITCDDDLGFRSDGHRVANYVVVAEAAS